MKLIVILCLFWASTGLAKEKKSEKKAPAKLEQKVEDMDPRVFFIEPKDAATVEQTFKVKMGVEGMKVCEANKPSKDKKCGHFHVLIDQAAFPDGEVIPKDEWHLHFGKKEKEAKMTLSPGKHLLTLQFADHAHLSYGAKLSHTITIDVK